MRYRILLAGLLCLVSLAAGAQYPNQPIKLMVGFAPSGGTDTAARIIAQKLAETVGQQVLVENRPGAGGNIAADLVAKAAPDGYTILLNSVGPLAVAPHMHSKLAFDPFRDFASVSLAVAFGNILVVHPSVTAHSLAEYLKLAAAKPMPYGSSGVGGMGHLAGELLKSLSKTSLEHVPYKGGGPAMADLLGGQIPSMFASAASAIPQIKAGKIRAIAVTSPKRSPFAPDIPTVAELGFPGYEAVNWYAFNVPAKTPREIVTRLNKEIVAILKNADTVAQLAKYGMEATPSTPEEMSAYVEREYKTWGRIVKQAAIKAD